MDKAKAKKIAETTADVAEFTLGGVLRLILRIVVTVLMVFLLTGMFFACIFAYYVKTELTPQLKITLEDASMDLSSTIWYTDSNGEAQELQMLTSTVNRIWVDYENLPDGMEHALVSIEDRRFYQHRGVDWYRTAGAVVQMFFSMSNDFGGSTITQQLIKNNTQNKADLVSRKLLEIFQALELERTYEKSEIIEWYLNTVYFGEGCYGVYTAAQTYFNKDVWDLSLAESASIIGITNNPSKYDPFIANIITDRDLNLTMTCREWNKYRQELILQQMYEQGYITYGELQSAKAEELNFVLPVNEVRSDTVNSFYVEMVVKDVLADLKEEFGYNDYNAEQRLYHGGLQIYACVDPSIQSIVDAVYQDVDSLPKPDRYTTDQQLQSGMMIVDPYTGAIKAVGGATGRKTANKVWNYATDSRRPVGSSIKPLASYGPALEYGLITQNTLVNDSRDVQLTGISNWYPRNSPNRYDDIITIRQALRDSKNTVAAQIVDKLTPEVSYNYLTQKLGFRLDERDIAYAPMALGELTVGATVREMAQAYTAFPNNGVMTYARSYTRVLDSNGRVVLDNEPETVTAFSPNTAANICNMLENAVNYGTGTDARINGISVAGKTGTTTDSRDRYFVGFTGYYVGAVWTGYDTPVVMQFSRNPAALIWRTVMEQVHEGLENRTFPAPVIGAPTNIFGNLTEAYQEQEYKKTHPEETEPPEESEAPEETQPPEQTPEETYVPADTPEPTIEQPVVTPPPGYDNPAPVDTWAPGGWAPSVGDPVGTP